MSLRERAYSSARMAKSSRLRPIPEELLKVVPGGGAPKGNPKGKSGLGVPPGKPFTAVTAASAAAARYRTAEGRIPGIFRSWCPEFPPPSSCKKRLRGAAAAHPERMALGRVALR